MKQKRKPIFIRQCDYCGVDIQTNEPNSDSYVITAEQKIFCLQQTPGKPAFKDCLEDYINDRKKNVQIKEKQKEEKRLFSQKKISVQEKQKVINKFETYLNELKRRSYAKRLS